MEKNTCVFRRNPFFTNALVGFSCFTLGDLFSQGIEKKSIDNIDNGKAFRTGLLGIIANGFFLPRWYKYLDQVFSTSMVGKAVVFKTIADQVVYAPFAIIAFFLWVSAVPAIKEENFKIVFENKMEKSFVATYLTG